MEPAAVSRAQGGNGGTHVLPPSSSLRGSLYTDFREGRKWKNLGGGTKFKEWAAEPPKTSAHPHQDTGGQLSPLWRGAHQNPQALIPVLTRLHGDPPVGRKKGSPKRQIKPRHFAKRPCLGLKPTKQKSYSVMEPNLPLSKLSVSLFPFFIHILILAKARNSRN